MLSFYLSILETEEEKDRFEQLYRMFKQDMYKVAYGILKKKEDAEDVVHQSFISIADNFKKVNEIPCQEIKSYVVVISKNHARNLYKKNKRTAKRRAEVDINTIADEADMFERYDYDQLVKTISELPEIYKDVIFLYYLENFTTKEIADMLDITVPAVWKRLERAKKLLKENLERDDDYAKQ